MVSIRKVIVESSNARTIVFNDKSCLRAVPAQFVMVWVPGYGEMPMSLSMIDRSGNSSITVKPVGVASTRICAMRAGELIGIRGPYGNGFTIHSGSFLLVGGGIGLAPLLPLAEVLLTQGSKITLVIAAKTSEELIFVEQMKSLLRPPKNTVLLTTENGSIGLRGVATDVASTILSKEKIDAIYTCGPEKMIAKLLKLADEKSIPMQASLERYLKCGIGICGTCNIGKYLVCSDGPVFTSDQLRQIPDEFGCRKRDSTGRYIRIQ